MTVFGRPRFLPVSGCSGGGKSTLIEELARRGYDTLPEPGRRILRMAEGPDDPRLPWNDLAAFARAALAMAEKDCASLSHLPGPVFCDRGALDAALTLLHAGGDGLGAAHRLRRRFDFGGHVILTPPWPAIFASDAERRHGFESASREYLRLRRGYRALGFTPLILPRTGTADRADRLLAVLGLPPRAAGAPASRGPRRKSARALW